MKPAVRSFSKFSLMITIFFGENLRSFWQIGLLFGFSFSLCSITSFGTIDMSEGSYANTLLLTLRKVVSTSSYLGSSSASRWMTLEGSSSARGTALVEPPGCSVVSCVHLLVLLWGCIAAIAQSWPGTSPGRHGRLGGCHAW